MGGMSLVGLLVAAAVVFATGYLLAREGAPYGTALLTVHKLLALASVIGVGVVVYRHQQTTQLSAWTWAGIAAAALLLVAAFASGGMMSAQSEPASWVGLAHRVTPWMATLAVVAVLVILGTAPDGDYEARFIDYRTINGDRVAVVEPIDEPGERQTAYTHLELAPGARVSVRYIGRSWDVPQDEPEREVVSVITTE